MITLTREEAQQVLDALTYHYKGRPEDYEAIYNLRARLSAPEPKQINYEEWKYNPMTGKPLWEAQPEPSVEPVAGYVWQEWTKEGNPFGIEQWLQKYGYFPPDAKRKQVREVRPLYTAPPQREWQSLTDKEAMSCWQEHINTYLGPVDFARAIEAKLKEKNG